MDHLYFDEQFKLEFEREFNASIIKDQLHMDSMMK
jgi:hypothetical protein